MSNSAQPGTVMVAASCPGGMARHFRVQVASTQTPSQWQLAASYRCGRAAAEAARQLASAGAAARVVAYSALPTAA
jgi:hypothetical protein